MARGMKRIETVKAWGHEHGKAKKLTRIATHQRGARVGYFNVRVRIVREVDYRDLVKNQGDNNAS